MTRSKSSGVAILAIFWALLMGAQNHGPLQPGAPGYSPSSWGAQAFEPESGAFEKDSYTNKYFDLSFPVLPDWREDYQGPPPSTSGYYVLEGLRPRGELNGTILIAAQDTFFLPVNNSLDLLKRRQEQAVVSLLKIEASPRKMKMGNQDFARLDYSGAGLYHAIFAIDLRCHIVTFEITTRDQGVLQKLATNVSNLSLHAGEGLARRDSRMRRAARGRRVVQTTLRRRRAGAARGRGRGRAARTRHARAVLRLHPRSRDARLLS